MSGKHRRPQRPSVFIVLGAAWMLASTGCSASEEPPHPPATSTLTTLAPTVSQGNPPLQTSPDPYEDVTMLLDGICYEALEALVGQFWTLTSEEDLQQFYDTVDAMDACPSDIQRAKHSFTNDVLLVTIAQATGCDAAFTIHSAVHSSADSTEQQARAWTIPAILQVVHGCEYELLEPLAIAVPSPPEGTTISLIVSQSVSQP